MGPGPSIALVDTGEKLQPRLRESLSARSWATFPEPKPVLPLGLLERPGKGIEPIRQPKLLARGVNRAQQDR